MIRIPNLLVARIFEPLWDKRMRSVRLQSWRELEASQWWAPERLAESRRDQLRALLIHASQHSPFHRGRLAEADIDPARVQGIEDLHELPLLTKSDIRQHLNEILSDHYDKQDLVAAKTGGSTGVALSIFCDRRAAQIRGGAALRSNEWSGWKLGEPVAATWGNPPIPGNFKEHIRQLLKERWFYLDTVRVTDEAISKFVTQWHQYRPGLLFGHAHSLYILAEALTQQGIHLKPNGIVSTSMMLIESERRVIEKTFGTPVTNRYGCEEVSLIASECELHQGMHINAEHCYVEILDDEGNPCPPGVDGRIVVTELINHGMPMIRYEVGDRGILGDRPCPCGRSLPILSSLTGRAADFLVASDGSQVSGISLIENTLTRLPGIKQMQIVQERQGHVIINMVPGSDHTPAVDNYLKEIMRKYLGESFALDINLQKEIPREKNGKYRFSICRLK